MYAPVAATEVESANIFHKTPGAEEILLTDVATISRDDVSALGPIVTNPYEEVTGANCPLDVTSDVIFWSLVVPTLNVPPDVATTTSGALVSCTRPLDAETMVAVPEICTNPDDTLTIGRLKLGALDHGFVAAVVVTVGTLDRLNTVERVTGIVPPDEATMTKGAELSVTVPELSDVALLKVNVWTLLSVTIPDDRAAADERVTMPLDRDRTR